MKLKQKPSWYHAYIRGHVRAANEAISMPWEHPIKSIMTLIALAICFYIPLLLWIIWLNYDDVKQNWVGRNSFITGPTEFPACPSALRDTRPELYNQAYPGEAAPFPSPIDTTAMLRIKTNTP